MPAFQDARATARRCCNLRHQQLIATFLNVFWLGYDGIMAGYVQSPALPHYFRTEHKESPAIY